MPSWKLHARWAKRLGVEESFAYKINRLIDQENPYGHDAGRRIKSVSYRLGRFILKEYGVLGFLAYLLHHAMDYMEYKIAEQGYVDLRNVIHKVWEVAFPVIMGQLTITRTGNIRYSPFSIRSRYPELYGLSRGDMDYYLESVVGGLVNFLIEHGKGIADDIRHELIQRRNRKRI